MNYKLSINDILAAARIVSNTLVVHLNNRSLKAPLCVYGIPRGGVSAALVLASVMDIVIVSSPGEANVILDDLVDSGATMQRYMIEYPLATFACLFAKGDMYLKRKLPYPVITGAASVGNEWLTFPWEVTESGHDSSAEDSVIRMLQAIGEDVTREGLIDTPKRVVKAWKEWFSGYNRNPADELKTFTDGADGVDEMILLTDIPVYSHCEHHITPFTGVAHVAYIPNGRIVGLSKIPKIVDIFSRRLQVQERLTLQIADCLQDHLDPLGVAVVIKAKHFCMCTRGVKLPNVVTTTSAMRGAFLDKPAARAEFMSLIPRD